MQAIVLAVVVIVFFFQMAMIAFLMGIATRLRTNASQGSQLRGQISFLAEQVTRLDSSIEDSKKNTHDALVQMSEVLSNSMSEHQKATHREIDDVKFAVKKIQSHLAPQGKQRG